MSESVEIDTDTLALLVQGSRHLYYPAFPDDVHRNKIAIAVNRAEELLENE